jgi:hypothetical protein
MSKLLSHRSSLWPSPLLIPLHYWDKIGAPSEGSMQWVPSMDIMAGKNNNND